MEGLKKVVWGVALVMPFWLILGGCVLLLNMV